MNEHFTPQFLTTGMPQEQFMIGPSIFLMVVTLY